MSASAFEEAYQGVGGLAATFRANEHRYLSPNYQEAEVRKDFIDKFFTELGWDVNHNEQTNPYEQEVKVEPSVSASGQRRADYAFYLAPNYRSVRFFVEAKKPYGDIASADNYFQTIRYAWNSETPLAVLTDFHQFHVLDCRYRPDIETALTRHVARYHYSEYIDRAKFAEIYWLFSREAVVGNSLEKRAQELPKPRGKAVQHGLFPGGYQSIDESFLNQLDEYRTALARTFKSKNPELDSETLTELVQRTLDRLVFLRFLEDKGIESQRIVDRFGERGTAWGDFVAASRRLDSIYNGIVFKRHEILDSSSFGVDDAEFAGICGSIAHVNSPYDFDAIPIHILGSIYERFLGNVIVATDKRVRVEPKPEVRKAGGVYYTPEYIVRYIVENTVGKLIAGKTPDQIATMRFADIACGSGSFLLGVFDYILTYHGQYYNDSPKKARKGDCINRDGKLFLSLNKKREILLNNIYGVDLDNQAVEVCQLSLYLRLLKDETTGSTHQHLLEFAHIAKMKKLLPDLTKNIVCGNSLVGTDVLDGQLFGNEEERRLNPMDFEDAFPDTMKRGGFDAIVGNPPYITYALGRGRLKHEDQEIEYISTHYPASSEYKINSFAIFYERALSLCRSKGLCAYIVPGTILINQALSKIRKHLLTEGRLHRAVQLGYRVFRGAEMGDCAILFAEKSKSPNYPVELHRYNSEKWDSGYTHEPIPSSAILALPECRIYMRAYAYEFLKISGRAGMQPLTNAARFYNGIKTGDNKRFLSARKESSRYVPVVRGRDFERYGTAKPEIYVLFDPEALWSNTDTTKLGAKDKILIRQTGDLLTATLDTNAIYCMDTVHFIYESQYDFKFLLGLINSKFLNKYHQLLVPESGKAFAEVKISNLQQLPIPLPPGPNAKYSRCQSQIVLKVEAMLEAKRQLAKAKTDKDKAYYESKCAALDRQIDGVVYELYGLTAEEIQIVEQ
jgi:type I restriction-modification system DNA methylase subunit